MKKLFSLLVACLLPFMSVASDYQEGTHYTKVQGLDAKQSEVREYFSFYCPHCFRFEPFIGQVKKQLPQGTALVKNHVDFLGGASHKMQHLLTQALVVAQALGKEAEMSEAIFKYIHVSRAVPTTLKDIRNIFVLNGVDGEEFDTLFQDEKIVAQVKEMKAHQNALAQSGGMTSVPTVIVNGKYRIENAALDKANFEQDYHKLVKHLLSLN